MRCDELPVLIDLYLDDELDALDRAEIDAHVTACRPCAELVTRQAELKACLRGLSGVHRLDPDFQCRLHAALSRVECRSESTPLPGRWQRVAAAAVALIAVPGAVFAVVSRTASIEASAATTAAPPGLVAPEVVNESVRWHSRPLPVEVTGPDGDAVAAWFRDKVDFPVAPPDFSRRAHLLGGRLGNVHDSEAAFLVYDVRGRKLSVMMFDADADDGVVGADGGEHDSAAGPYYVGQRNGYNVAVHERDGVAYTFTSDLPDRELVDLVNVAFSY